MSATTTHAPSSASRSAIARPIPEPAPVTNATRPASGGAGGRSASLRSSSSQYSTAELLRVGDRRVRRHRLRAAHHVDRVHEELAGDPRVVRVGAVAPHADAGEQDDRGVGTPHRWRIGHGVRGVVRRVVGAVLEVQLAESRRRASSKGAPGGRSSSRGFTLVRRKWSGHDVPSAASRGADSWQRKSSTTGASEKHPTIGRSVEARPRTTGASRAASARRASSRIGARVATTTPNGSVLP